MDGVEATRQIMKRCPRRAGGTATVEGNAAQGVEAMGHGALDAWARRSWAPRARSWAAGPA